MQQYTTHANEFVTWYSDEVKTREWCHDVMASIKVAVVIPGVTKVRYYTYSVIARSARIARVLLKQELNRAMAMKDRPGYTH